MIYNEDNMKKELTQVYVEKYQKDWLRKEAKKRKLSIASIIRALIELAIKK